MSHHHHEHSKRDKHSDDVDTSQVRSIIRQLNEESPSKEKHREVVVRPDGTKMVRVTKKRKVMITNEEKRRHGRRAFMLVLFVLMLVGAAVAGFFSYRMSVMSGERFLAEREQELARYWGASSVRCSGAMIDGVQFHISNVVAEFPENSMVERVELSEINSELDLVTFFSGLLSGDELTIARAHIQLRASARQLHLPQAQGEELWRFLRVSCPDFSISVNADAASPWSVQHSSAYMYRPSSDSPLTVVTLEGGVMQMRGWKDIAIRSAKAHISRLAVEDFSLTGTTDSANSTSESSRTAVYLTGRVADGGELAGPYYFVADNMNLSEFTEGRFNHFLSARTVRPAVSSGTPASQILLPFENAAPQFSGTFHLKEVSLSGFPALQLIIEHLEPVKRKRYMPPSILFADVRLSHEGDTMVLSFDEGGMSERDVITLRGCFRVDAQNNLSGNLDYGIPSVLTHAEYRDGRADPIFREDAQLAWVTTRLSGPAARPEDDSHELDARASAERASRERIPFEDIDLERINEQFKSRDEVFAPKEGEAHPLDEGGSLLDGRLSPDGALSPDRGLEQSGGHALDSPF